MREVMRTELIRIRAVIVVSLVIMVNVALVHMLFPDVVEASGMASIRASFIAS